MASNTGTRANQRLQQSSSLNHTRTNQTREDTDRGGRVLQGTGISFTAGDTISDSGNGLGIFAVGDVIRIQGSAANNRRFRVATSAAGTLTVTPAQVQTASAGAVIIIRKE